MRYAHLTWNEAMARLDGSERRDYMYWWRNLVTHLSAVAYLYEVEIGPTSIRPCDWPT